MIKHSTSNTIFLTFQYFR